MNKKIFIAFSIALCAVTLLYAKKKTEETISGGQESNYILITFLYNEIIPARIEEYIICMETNIQHKKIQRIHVLYDITWDNKSQKQTILDYLLRQPKITIDYIEGRPTYGMCFALANDLYQNSNIILANADIFFNETLSLLDNYDLTNKFLALTRWNLHKDGSIQPYYIIHHGVRREQHCSQDAWIFQTPFPKLLKDNIAIGVQACDMRIAYWANKSGLKVINPCLSIQCIHVHTSGIRHYGKVNLPSDILVTP